jgi:hypothetical protein
VDTGWWGLCGCRASCLADDGLMKSVDAVDPHVVVWWLSNKQVLADY